MVVGHLPFEKDNFYAMYEAIKNDEPGYPDHLSKDLKDLLEKMLAKDPSKRITCEQMRQHPWTQAVEDGILLSKDDNLEKVVSEITDEDLDCAICKITNIFTFARAISRFKKGGSMARARREASRSTSGESTHDASWFPPSTPSPDKPSRANTKDSEAADADKKPRDDVSTIKEETPTPETHGKGADDGKREEEVEDLQKAAANMFDSPQMQTFELPPSEPDGNGPLQRTRSVPLPLYTRWTQVKQATAHRSSLWIRTQCFTRDVRLSNVRRQRSLDRQTEQDDEDDNADVQKSHDSSSVNTSSRSGNTEDHSTDYTADTSKPDESLANRLSDMMLRHEKQHDGDDDDGDDAIRQKRREEVLLDSQTSKDDDEDTSRSPPRAQSLEERAASLGSKRASKPKPKLLPDQPTCESPHTEAIKTPPGASKIYVQCGHGLTRQREVRGQVSKNWRTSRILVL